MRQLLEAMFRDLGRSKKSAALRARGVMLMIECERRGIDPFAEIRKAIQASRLEITLPPFPIFTFSIPTPGIESPLD